MQRLRLTRDLSAVALLLAASLLPMAAHAQSQPLLQLDIPAPPDLSQTIGQDLAAQAGVQDNLTTSSLSKHDQADTTGATPEPKATASTITQTLASDPPLQEASIPEATASGAAAAQAPVASGPSALALIERATEAGEKPELTIDIPLPEPFVSFDGIDTGKAETRAAEAPTADPTPRAGEAASETPQTKSAEAPIHLDIPAPPDVVAIIDIPKADEATSKSAPGPARTTLALNETKIRAFLEPHRARLRLRPTIIESFVATYQLRENRALWLNAEGNPLPDITSLVTTLREAAADGLDPERLLALLPNVKPGATIAPDLQEQTELALSLAAFTFASDARGGRLDPRSLSAMLTPKLSLPSPQEVLEAIDSRGERPVSAVLSAFLPQHKGYQGLRSELAKARAAQSEPAHTASIGGGADHGMPQRFMGDAPLAIGQSDARVPQLRARLRLPASDDVVYSSALVEAVKEFQRANDLTPNGRITPRTRALLDDPKSPAMRSEKRPDHERRIADLVANMERWRWLPPELGATHIFVNIPEFRMEMRTEGEQVFETRVIVGKVESQTPVFSDSMEFLVVNPSWTIPPTILKRDYLPKLAADPEYASRKGFEVIRRGNNISIRQPPGEKNALGHIKFMFPNDHHVYLHDTPGRHLFASGTRAFSAGCVRVEGPFRLAEAMLAKQGLGEKTLRGMVGRGERTIRLQERFPVHLAYFTLFVDQAGVLQSRPDLYGHDQRLRRALQI